jgi:hypothetical protein
MMFPAREEGPLARGQLGASILALRPSAARKHEKNLIESGGMHSDLATRIEMQGVNANVARSFSQAVARSLPALKIEDR